MATTASAAAVAQSSVPVSCQAPQMARLEDTMMPRPSSREPAIASTARASLRAVTGDEEERVGHALPERPGVVGIGGADDRADVGEAAVGDAIGTPVVDQVGGEVGHGAVGRTARGPGAHRSTGSTS